MARTSETINTRFSAHRYVHFPLLIFTARFDDPKAAVMRTIARHIQQTGHWRTVGRQFPPYEGDGACIIEDVRISSIRRSRLMSMKEGAAEGVRFSFVEKFVLPKL